MRLKLACGREELWVEFPEGQPVNVAQALGSVADRRPGIYERWCDKEGQLRRSLAVFVNGEHIRYREGLETELSDGDEVYVIPLIAGG
jgi:molybdopterin converting factor small subunit